MSDFINNFKYWRNSINVCTLYRSGGYRNSSFCSALAMTLYEYEDSVVVIFFFCSLFLLESCIGRSFKYSPENVSSGIETAFYANTKFYFCIRNAWQWLYPWSMSCAVYSDLNGQNKTSVVILKLIKKWFFNISATAVGLWIDVAHVKIKIVSNLVQQVESSNWKSVVDPGIRKYKFTQRKSVIF